MKYMEWIKESKTYTCPKGGIYKIICVGGGASGGLKGLKSGINQGKMLGFSGGATSFGNMISAEGGTTCVNIGDKNSIAGGQSGYDGINYGASPFYQYQVSTSIYHTNIGDESLITIETGHGYGAGGGAFSTSINYDTFGNNRIMVDTAPCSGRCGRMESIIVDLDEGQTVPCTIGKGGVANLTEDIIKEFLNDSTYKNLVGMNIESISNCMKNGADGLIVVQYLGESM